MSLPRILPPLAALALAALPAGAREARTSDVYAIVGARVVTVSGATLESATVVLRDGLIEAVGAAVAAPADARVLDGKGLTLTPGLFDGFGGVGLPSKPPAGRGGEPGGGRASGGEALAPAARALDKLQPAEALKARDAGLTTALVVPRDGVLPGRAVLVSLSGETADAMVLREPAAFLLRMATLPRQYPGSLMGTLALARQALLDARRQQAAWQEWERAPRGRVRPAFDRGLQAWAEVALGRLPLIVAGTRENDLRRAQRLADEFGVRVIAAGAPFAHRMAETLKQKPLPLLVSVDFDPPKPAAFFGGPDEDKQRAEIAEAEANPARLHEAGVAFALVSGHGKDFLGGVRKAIERGLPREAALRAVTLAPAELLGVADRLGSLEPGKIANLVAWSGEPLAKESKVKMVFVDGSLYEPPDKPDKPEGKPGEAARPDAAEEVAR